MLPEVKIYPPPLRFALEGKLPPNWYEHAKSLSERLSQMCAHVPLKDGRRRGNYMIVRLDRIPEDLTQLTLKQWLGAILYIGKATFESMVYNGSGKYRPYAHVKAALKKTGFVKGVNMDLVNTIRDLYEENIQVGIVELASCNSDEEAFSREAAMIMAVDYKNLANKDSGEFQIEGFSINDRIMVGIDMILNLVASIKKNETKIKRVVKDEL